MLANSEEHNLLLLVAQEHHIDVDCNHEDYTVMDYIDVGYTHVGCMHVDYILYFQVKYSRRSTRRSRCRNKC